MRGRGPCGQYISKKRPSRFVILSETKDLCAASQILRFTQDDTPQTASFDWQQVLFEMYWPLWPPAVGDACLLSLRNVSGREVGLPASRPGSPTGKHSRSYGVELVRGGFRNRFCIVLVQFSL